MNPRILVVKKLNFYFQVGLYGQGKKPSVNTCSRSTSSCSYDPHNTSYTSSGHSPLQLRAQPWSRTSCLCGSRSLWPGVRGQLPDDLYTNTYQRSRRGSQPQGGSLYSPGQDMRDPLSGIDGPARGQSQQGHKELYILMTMRRCQSVKVMISLHEIQNILLANMASRFLNILARTKFH